MNILKMFGLDSESREQRLVKKYRDLVVKAQKADYIRNAKWCHQEAKNLYKAGKPDSAKRRLMECISYIMMAHIDDPASIYSGYSLDMSLPTMMAKIQNARYKVLEPKLLEIISCNEESKKSELVQGLTWIMMCIMDPSGCTIKSRMFFEIFDAREINEVTRSHKDEYLKGLLEPLGFKPHKAKEDGEEFTIWYYTMLAA